MKILLGFALLLGAPLWGHQLISRTVLALYNSQEGAAVADDANPIHDYVEMVLNHLGVTVRYANLALGLPSEDASKDAFAIISWFDAESLPDPRGYCEWARRQVAGGKRFVILGHVGALSAGPAVVNGFLETLSLHYENELLPHSEFVMHSKDPLVIDYEAPFSPAGCRPLAAITAREATTIYLSVAPAHQPGRVLPAVTVTARGALALEGTLLRWDASTGGMRWTVDPFRFFEEALDLKDLPRYDTTTAFGRRIFFSHIDSRGASAPTTIEPYDSCLEAVYHEVLTKLDLPVTLSFSSSDIDSDESKNTLVHAKAALQLPHIQPASCVCSCESLWSDTAARYNEALEAATRFAMQMSPGNKRLRGTHWSGDCRPPAEALAFLESRGLYTLNGGGSRLDSVCPSYTGVAPLVRQVGGHLQIYAPCASDSDMTEDFASPPFGMRLVVETFRQTELPTILGRAARRVAPINVHAHFQSGGNQTLLTALKEVFSFASRQKITPMFASQYCAVVEGFLKGRVWQLDDGGFHFESYGACQTVRFDREDLYPDLARSRGILGFNHWEGHLYVHLSEHGIATLYLTHQPPTKPYLAEASTPVHSLSLQDDEIVFISEGHGPAHYLFKGLFPGSVWQVSAMVLDSETASTSFSGLEMKTKAGGVLRLDIPGKGMLRVRAIHVNR